MGHPQALHIGVAVRSDESSRAALQWALSEFAIPEALPHLLVTLIHVVSDVPNEYGKMIRVSEAEPQAVAEHVSENVLPFLSDLQDLCDEAEVASSIEVLKNDLRPEAIMEAAANLNVGVLVLGGSPLTTTWGTIAYCTAPGKQPLGCIAISVVDGKKHKEVSSTGELLSSRSFSPSSVLGVIESEAEGGGSSSSFSSTNGSSQMLGVHNGPSSLVPAPVSRRERWRNRNVGKENEGEVGEVVGPLNVDVGLGYAVESGREDGEDGGGGGGGGGERYIGSYSGSPTSFPAVVSPNSSSAFGELPRFSPRRISSPLPTIESPPSLTPQESPRASESPEEKQYFDEEREEKEADGKGGEEEILGGKGELGTEEGKNEPWEGKKGGEVNILEEIKMGEGEGGGEDGGQVNLKGEGNNGEEEVGERGQGQGILLRAVEKEEGEGEEGSQVKGEGEGGGQLNVFGKVQKEEVEGEVESMGLQKEREDERVVVASEDDVGEVEKKEEPLPTIPVAVEHRAALSETTEREGEGEEKESVVEIRTVDKKKAEGVVAEGKEEEEVSQEEMVDGVVVEGSVKPVFSPSVEACIAEERVVQEEETNSEAVVEEGNAEKEISVTQKSVEEEKDKEKKDEGETKEENFVTDVADVSAASASGGDGKEEEETLERKYGVVVIEERLRGGDGQDEEGGKAMREILQDSTGMASERREQSDGAGGERGVNSEVLVLETESAPFRSPREGQGEGEREGEQIQAQIEGEQARGEGEGELEQVHVQIQGEQAGGEGEGEGEQVQVQEEQAGGDTKTEESEHKVSGVNVIDLSAEDEDLVPVIGEDGLTPLQRARLAYRAGNLQSMTSGSSTQSYSEEGSGDQTGGKVEFALPPPSITRAAKMSGKLASKANLPTSMGGRGKMDRKAKEEAEIAVGRAIRESMGQSNVPLIVPRVKTDFKIYAMKELHVAMDHFWPNHILGEGSYGIVYRGMLDGVDVAIKQLKNPEHNAAMEEIERELEVQKRCEHSNLVRLLGYSIEDRSLVYEYLCNGSLEDRLLCMGGSPPLLWPDRCRIAMEVAAALHHLHTRNPPIVHRDVKPANVLLDADFVAKLGDVGLARLMADMQNGNTHIIRKSVIVGTEHYVDPEYLCARRGYLGPKSDVYSFGIVLLQLLVGGIPNLRKIDIAVEQDNLNTLLDQRAGEWPKGLVMDMANLGLWCSEMDRKDRPDLEEEVIPALLEICEGAAAEVLEQEVKKERARAEAKAKEEALLVAREEAAKLKAAEERRLEDERERKEAAVAAAEKERERERERERAEREREREKERERERERESEREREREKREEFKASSPARNQNQNMGFELPSSNVKSSPRATPNLSTAVTAKTGNGQSSDSVSAQKDKTAASGGCACVVM